MKILIIDSCIRKNSKTRIMLNKFMDILKQHHNDINIIYLNNNKKLVPLNDILLEKRNNDCINMDFKDEYYDFAKELKNCDIVIVAAPFYDLCFPAIFKTFIEQTLVYNLTFVDSTNGIKGLTNCKKMIYLAVRGMSTNEFNLDIATPYLKGYCNMLGIKELYSLTYDGISYEDLEANLDNDINPFYEKCFNN